MAIFIAPPQINAQDRFGECDRCGYCQGKTPPSSWESCRQCLYPTADKDHKKNDTLKINLRPGDTYNRQATPFPGNYYTQIGCLKTSANDFENPAAAGGITNQLLTKFIFPTVGGLAFLYLIYGAFLIATSQNDPSKLNQGKMVATGSIVGLIFVLSSVFLVSFISSGVLRIPFFMNSPAAKLTTQIDGTRVRQSVYLADGKTRRTRDCVLNAATDPPIDCTNAEWQEADFGTRNDGITSKVNSYSTSAYNNFTRTLSVTVDNDNKTVRYRTCNIDYSGCGSWNPDTNVLSGVPFRVSGLSANVTGPNSVIFSIVDMDGTSGYYRSCGFTDGNPATINCTSPWTSSPNVSRVQFPVSFYQHVPYMEGSVMKNMVTFVSFDGKTVAYKKCNFPPDASCNIGEDEDLPTYTITGDPFGPLKPTNTPTPIPPASPTPLPPAAYVQGFRYGGPAGDLNMKIYRADTNELVGENSLKQRIFDGANNVVQDGKYLSRRLACGVRYKVVLDVPAGYTAGYSLDLNGINHPEESYVQYLDDRNILFTMPTSFTADYEFCLADLHVALYRGRIQGRVFAPAGFDVNKLKVKVQPDNRDLEVTNGTFSTGNDTPCGATKFLALTGVPSGYKVAYAMSQNVIIPTSNPPYSWGATTTVALPGKPISVKTNEPFCYTDLYFRVYAVKGVIQGIKEFTSGGVTTNITSVEQTGCTDASCRFTVAPVGTIPNSYTTDHSNQKLTCGQTYDIRLQTNPAGSYQYQYRSALNKNISSEGYSPATTQPVVQVKLPDSPSAIPADINSAVVCYADTRIRTVGSTGSDIKIFAQGIPGTMDDGTTWWPQVILEINANSYNLGAAVNSVTKTYRSATKIKSTDTVRVKFIDDRPISMNLIVYEIEIDGVTYDSENALSWGIFDGSCNCPGGALMCKKPGVELHCGNGFFQYLPRP